MARGIPALVQPALLIWARQSAGIALEEAARKAHVDVEVLSKWEEGEALPSIPQLRKLGEIYKRPLAVFFLSEPPQGFDPQREFRRLPGVTPQNESSELRLALRTARFWLTVQSLCPEADSAKQWLRFNGSKLRCDLKRVCGSA